MVEVHHDAKVCPILAAFSGSRDTVSTGGSWATRCKGTECAWWDAERHHCAVTVISQELGQIFASGLLAQPA
jgi:hypothetical protein